MPVVYVRFEDAHFSYTGEEQTLGAELAAAPADTAELSDDAQSAETPDAIPPGTVWFHSEQDPQSDGFDAGDWQEGLPSMRDAGERTFYVRAENESCTFDYVDAEVAGEGALHYAVCLLYTSRCV